MSEKSPQTHRFPFRVPCAQDPLGHDCHPECPLYNVAGNNIIEKAETYNLTPQKYIKKLYHRGNLFTRFRNWLQGLTPRQLRITAGLEVMEVLETGIFNLCADRNKLKIR